MLGFAFIVPYRKNEKVNLKISELVEMCHLHKIVCEFFLVEGNHPTFQRNRCIEKAKKKYVYFLDNDTTMNPESFNDAVELIKADPSIGILGGPSILPEGASDLEKSIQSLFSNYLAIGPSISRYSARGSLREASDQELILCNLIVRRDVFDKVGLLDEELYPNEENAFISRAKKAGIKAMYDPRVTVFRPQRNSFRAFFIQIFTYGRGRGEQTRLFPRSFISNLLIPISYPFYLMSLFILLIGQFLPYKLILAVFFPLMLYTIIFIYVLTKDAVEKKKWDFRLAVLYLSNHLLYGLGFWKGFFFPKRRLRKNMNFKINYISGEDIEHGT